MWRQPTQPGGVASGDYSHDQFQQAVEQEVARRIAKINQTQSGQNPTPPVKESSGASEQRTQVATARNRSRMQPRNRLTREERVQLASDLGLIQGREEETPFVLPDEPNQ
jgi:hypothetical protein